MSTGGGVAVKNGRCYIGIEDYLHQVVVAILLIVTLLLVARPGLATEFSQQLPGMASRGSNAGMAGIGAVGRLFETFVADEKDARDRVRETAQRVLAVRDPSQRNYFRVEYLGARTKHVGTYVIFLVGTLREKARLEKSIREARASFDQLSASPTIRGMRRLIVLVMDLAEEEGRTSDTEEIGRRAVRDINLSILANLTAEPVGAVQAQERLKRVDERCKGGLKILRGELSYLEARLDEVKEQ
jgi:hypothetical protein